MRTRELMVLNLLAVVVVIGAVTAYHVTIGSPGRHVIVRVESDKATGETTVDTPFAQLEKDDQGTRVAAPGVKVETPKSPSN